jgi:CRP-like cAMP-binding protein
MSSYSQGVAVSHSDSSSPTIRNHLLAALPSPVLSRLRPKLEPVTLSLGKILLWAEEPIEAVYFLEKGMVSLIAALDEGMRAEVGIIGREGIVGMPLVFGVDTSFVEAQVQIPGSALRMSSTMFQKELEESPLLRALLLRYAEAAQAHVSQTAACNARHGLEQRLARWLLMVQDRTEGNELPLTQEFLAAMLGVHRPSITVTAGILQRAGLIQYRSGNITIFDRSGLEAAACECYGLVKRRLAKLRI